MEFLFSLMAIFLLLDDATSTTYSSGVIGENCNGPPVTGCNIRSGLAECRDSSLPLVVQALPTCVYRLHFSHDHGMEYKNVINFGHLDNLKELVIKSGFIAYPSFHGLSALQLLRFKMVSFYNYTTAMDMNILKDIPLPL